MKPRCRELAGLRTLGGVLAGKPNPRCVYSPKLITMISWKAKSGQLLEVSINTIWCTKLGIRNLVQRTSSSSEIIHYFNSIKWLMLGNILIIFNVKLTSIVVLRLVSRARSHCFLWREMLTLPPLAPMLRASLVSQRCSAAPVPSPLQKQTPTGEGGRENWLLWFLEG